MLKKILSSFKFIKWYDVLSIIVFIIILPISLIYRIFNKINNREIWLICEDGKNARDNGYHLFKYIRKNHPEELCYYVIDKKSNGYDKVKEFGNIIQYRSMKHWLYYLISKWNISTQKNGNPNQVLFYVLHVYLNLFNNRVFIQHGITKDLSPWIFYKNTKFKYFICGAKREFEYINEKFGYPDNNVKYLGFARFDNLVNNNEVNNNQILVMPTWRNWLRETNGLLEENNIEKTEFYIKWMEFLNSDEFIEFIEKNNIKVLFYPHIHMMRFLDKFEFKSKQIEKMTLDDDIQDIMKQSALMITDYSSVYMDFAYMEKPIIYYQFDMAEYRKNHLQEGYFNYERDGFGPVMEESKGINEYLEKLYFNNKFNLESKYLNRMNGFFELKDTENCKRHYDLLKNG